MEGGREGRKEGGRRRTFMKLSRVVKKTCGSILGSSPKYLSTSC